MNKLLALMFCVVMFGCSMNNPNIPKTPEDWESMSGSIANFTELSARTIFASEKAKPHQASICKVVGEIMPLLQTYNDPNASFAALENLIIDSVKKSPNLNDVNRPIVVLAVKQVLIVTSTYSKEAYAALVQKDSVKSVLVVSKAVASGLTSACQNGAANNMSSLRVTKQSI